jgi:basic membrane protein A
MHVRRRNGAAAFVLLVLPVGCGNDDEDAVEREQTDPVATSAAGQGTAIADPDTTGDGNVVVGLALPGDRNDGGFEQATVEAVEAKADEHGFDVVIVDRVTPETATDAIANLVRQDADLVVANGSELIDGVLAVSESGEFADRAYIVSAPEEPRGAYTTMSDNLVDVNYTAGKAARLILDAEGVDGGRAAFIGGPEFDYVQAASDAFANGFAEGAEGTETTTTFTGDFDDAALAQEATIAQLRAGADIVYAYLGLAMDAAAQEANEADVPVIAAAVDLCEQQSPEYAASAVFDPGGFLTSVIDRYMAGEFVEGEFVFFPIGTPEVTVSICDGSAEQQDSLNQTMNDLADGTIVAIDG